MAGKPKKKDKVLAKHCCVSTNVAADTFGGLAAFCIISWNHVVNAF